VPDLPEPSRAPREGPDAHSPRGEVLSEPRAAEPPATAPAGGSDPAGAATPPATPHAPAGNGARDPLDGLGGRVSGIVDPFDRDSGGGDGEATSEGEHASDDPTLPATTADAPATTELHAGDGPRAGTVPAGTGTAGTGDDEDGGDGAEGDADSAGRDRKAGRSGWRSVIEWGLVIGGALLVALIVRTFLVQPFWIPSASMEPTLHEGDRVLVNKLSYDLHDVHHGDVIVFERPDEPNDVPHPENEIPDLIKRVIGLPGDTLQARDGVVYLNGERLDEPYLAPDTPTTDLDTPVTVPEGHVFVMGDNRTNSHDSRKFGPIPESSIVGRAFLRIYPLDDIGGL
jgi:signal peptidase I